MSLFQISDSRRMRGGKPQDSFALILTLAFIVIVSALLVGFVTLMRQDRSATASYSQSLRAEQVGLGGLRLVTSELVNEMGKDAPPEVNATSQLLLFTNVNSGNILPQVIGGNAVMPNLLKISTNAPPFTGSRANGTLLASTVGSTVPSRNGRSVTTERWNQAWLGSFPAGANTPAWVLVTRNGPTNGASMPFDPKADGSVNNSGAANASYVLGRFAYAVYDEGGLLDVTVAGHPSSLTPANLQALKGTLAGADVAALGINADELVKWRNAASRNDYPAYVTSYSATNAFKKIYPGDTTFVGRQDLIKAAQNNVAGLSTNSLPNLTTFTRERNSPSFAPKTPTGSTIGYAAQSMSSFATNSFVPYIRHTTATTVTSYNLDGTPFTYQVRAGDPIVYHRFPLDRLKWITANGVPNGGTAASIKACFGLTFDPASGVWQYTGALDSTERGTIKRLSQVQAEKREPDFFELLFEGILSGSLGQSNGNSSMYFANIHQLSVVLQTLKIGASIISQYEPTGAPIAVEYLQTGEKWVAVGVDNLPYLTFAKVVSGASPDDPTSSLASYFTAGLWNPHRSITAAPIPPVRLRIKAPFTIMSKYASAAMPNVSAAGSSAKGNAVDIDATVLLSASAGKGVNGFTDARTLAPDDVDPIATGSSPAGLEWAATPPFDAAGNRYAGYRLPDLKFDFTIVPPAGSENADLWATVLQFIGFGGKWNVWLEYQSPAPGNPWIAYNFLNGINASTSTWTNTHFFAYAAYLGHQGGTHDPPPAPPPFYLESSPNFNVFYARNYSQTPGYFLVDPRSNRFGPFSMYTTSQKYYRSSMWGSDTEPYFQDTGLGGSIPYTDTLDKYSGVNFIPAIYSASPMWPAWTCRNNEEAKLKTAYKDFDGVMRMADSGLFSGLPKANAWTGDPYAKAADRVADRPVVLNRPFVNVAEMGYVSRDYPWRTLDFFTGNSADSGLLDLFSVSQANEPVMAGRVSLNSRNPAVLTAVLNNTIAEVASSTGVSKPAQIAARLAANPTPLAGKDELATVFVPTLTSAEFATPDEQNVKTQREAVVRALADVGQTRTWNLMIDLVAQAGRYPPNATSLEQFVVEGERRYWLHVAVDRFTGEIIDQQLELPSQ